MFGSNGYINTIYTYTPYGEVTSSGSTAQPLQWSSEFYDDELGLVYHNFRHYSPTTGRWLGRDPKGENYRHNINLLRYIKNNPTDKIDELGLEELTVEYILHNKDWDLTNLSTYAMHYLVMDIQIISKKKEFDPNSQCGAEDCIKELIIFAHGQYFDQYQMSTMYFMDGSIVNNMSESDIFTEISDFINNANIKFCSEATLDIRSCNIGKNRKML